MDFNNQSYSWGKNLWLVSLLLLITHAHLLFVVCGEKFVVL